MSRAVRPPVRVAQIGVGYWGPNLLRNLANNPRCELRTVAELSAARRRFVAEHYPGCRVVAEPEGVFGDTEIDAVVIATPAGTHFDLAMKALRAGKHILVEKPLASSSAEVRAIDREAKRRKRVAMAGHTFLYHPAVRKVKELIDSGRLGRVRYIYSQRLNLGRIRRDVDALWNLAPHDLSILQYWLDGLLPESAARYGRDFVQKGIDDVVFVNLAYPRGIMANIHVSWLDPHRVRRMTIVGSKKMAVYDDAARDKVVVYDKGIDSVTRPGKDMIFDDAGYEKAYRLRSGEAVAVPVESTEPLKAEVDHFLDCIQQKVRCLTGPRHALGVVRTLELCSVRSRRTPPR